MKVRIFGFGSLAIAMMVLAPGISVRVDGDSE